MPQTINFGLEEVTRDLAEMYAKGHMTIDEYLDTWETVTRAYVTPSEA